MASSFCVNKRISIPMADFLNRQGLFLALGAENVGIIFRNLWFTATYRALALKGLPCLKKAKDRDRNQALARMADSGMVLEQKKRFRVFLNICQNALPGV